MSVERHVTVAAVQMNSGQHAEANLAAALAGIDQAAARGAALVVLPELFTCLGRPEAIVAAAQTVPGPTTDALSGAAARCGLTLVAGSLPERSEVPGRVWNTSLVFDAQGTIRARYRKLHRFDVDLPGRVTYRESNWVAAGDEVVVVETPLGRLGLAICYDLRFPELFRQHAAAGAEWLVVPSAFAEATGRDHWEVLLRARAIENQAFVIAANQCGTHGGALTTHGHSAIVDPWGRVLAMAADRPEVITAVVDRAQLAEVRRQLPALAHRRPLPPTRIG